MTRALLLGVTLTIGWIILPFAACVVAFITFGDDELAGSSIAATALLSLPLILGTWIYTGIAVKRCASTSTGLVPTLLLVVPLSGVIGWSLIANASPRRITPDMSGDSPFDKHWYSAPQTSFGSPAPFLRIFDRPLTDVQHAMTGTMLFDFSTFLADVTIWCFPVFIIVSVAYIRLSPRRDGE